MALAAAVLAALAVLPGGGLRGGEPTSGAVRDLDARGRPAGTVLVTLPVSTGGHLVLLGGRLVIGVGTSPRGLGVRRLPLTRSPARKVVP